MNLSSEHPRDRTGRPLTGGLVEWAITARCDLQCQHCYSASPRGRELTTERALALADQLVAARVQAVALSGGEPTLRHDWPLVTERLASGGVATRMISNGQTLDREGLQRARDAGLDFIWFSLDGLEATHDRIRRAPGAFSRVMEAATQASAVGLPFGFMTTVLSSNRHQLRPLARLAEEHGASRWQVWLGVPQDASGLWLPPHEHPSLAAELLGMARTDPRLRLGDNIKGLLEGARCEAGKKVLALLGDGSAKGCLALPGPASRLTIQDAPLADLWRLARSQGIQQNDHPGGNGCQAMALALAARRARPGQHRGARTSTLVQATAWTSSLLLASTLSLGCPQKDRPGPPATGPAPSEVQQAPVKSDPKQPASAPALPPEATGKVAQPNKRPAPTKGTSKNRSSKNSALKLHHPVFRPCMTSHVGCRDLLLTRPGAGKPKKEAVPKVPVPGSGNKKP